MQVPAELTVLPPSAGSSQAADDVNLRPHQAFSPTRQRVAGIGLWSVAKVSLAFYLVVGLCLVTAGVVLSLASSSTGFTSHLQHLARTLFGARSLPLGPAHVAAAVAVGAAAIAVVGTMINVVGALVYNLIADLVGGIGWRRGE